MKISAVKLLFLEAGTAYLFNLSNTVSPIQYLDMFQSVESRIDTYHSCNVLVTYSVITVGMGFYFYVKHCWNYLLLSQDAFILGFLNAH